LLFQLPAHRKGAVSAARDPAAWRAPTLLLELHREFRKLPKWTLTPDHHVRHSAANVLIDLARLAERDPGTTIV
jgi:hypothetical protein